MDMLNESFYFVLRYDFLFIISVGNGQKEIKIRWIVQRETQ